AEAVLRTMFVTKVKVAVAVLVAATVLAAGTGVIAFQMASGRRPTAEQREPPAVARPEMMKPEDTTQTRVDWAGAPLPEQAISRLGTLRFRHDGEAWGVAFSPNGKLLASATFGAG